jgi:hypothetical protein
MEIIIMRERDEKSWKICGKMLEGIGKEKKNYTRYGVKKIKAR